MRIPLLSLLLFIPLAAALLYLYFVIRKRLTKRKIRNRVMLTVMGVESVGVAVGLTGLILPARSGESALLLCKMWMVFAFLTVIFPTLLFCIIDALSMIPLIWKGKRWYVVSWAAIVASVTLMLSMWWGALDGRFDLKVKMVEVASHDIPEAYDGYRIVQFSDLHLGTYGSDTTYVAKLVDAINALEPDLIVFTGDLVNRTGDELTPFTSVLSRLNAADGVISIMGNHDYGDYFNWESPEAKSKALAGFQQKQRDMGWNLLLNEHIMLHHGGDSMAIVGVENVGDPPFVVYGDLRTAQANLGDTVTQILLTHNPAHWEQEIANSDKNLLLTLSGHTHAMQMNFAGWSPAALRYKYWSGLYDDDKGHNLYVDSGVGTVGFPMRLGVSPQVTLITLRKQR